MVRCHLRGHELEGFALDRTLVSRHTLVSDSLLVGNPAGCQRWAAHRGYAYDGGEQLAVVLRATLREDPGDQHLVGGALHRPEGPRVPVLHLGERLLPAWDCGGLGAAERPAGDQRQRQWSCTAAELPAGALRAEPAGPAELQPGRRPEWSAKWAKSTVRNAAGLGRPVGWRSAAAGDEWHERTAAVSAWAGYARKPCDSGGLPGLHGQRGLPANKQWHQHKTPEEAPIPAEHGTDVSCTPRVAERWAADTSSYSPRGMFAKRCYS
mmetsp:Transcript_1170/g.3382  ORF Transcript_1170/g.3382 Transcript_1170/m.3382 type:complete len:266 (-) Transcript_1170:90-887(-)